MAPAAHLRAAATGEIYAHRPVRAGLLGNRHSGGHMHRAVRARIDTRCVIDVPAGCPDGDDHRFPDGRAARFRKTVRPADPDTGLHAVGGRRRPVHGGAVDGRRTGGVARVHRTAQLGADASCRRAHRYQRGGCGMTQTASDATVVIPRVTVPKQRVAAPRPPLEPQPIREATSTRGRRVPPDVLIALGLTALVLVVQAWNITGFPYASDDEGTYLAQPWDVRHGYGLAHYTYWYDHPPLGWIQLAGMAWIPSTLLPHALAVGTGRLAMLPVAAVSLLLVYPIVRRLGLARWAAALAVLAYGLSPISVTMMRQIYLDSFAVMWILAALALALSPRKHLWHHTAAGVAAGLAVLSKETMLIALPGVVVALWQGTAKTPVRAWAFGGFAAGLVLVGVFYPLYAILKGELIPGPGHVSLIGAWQFQLGNRHGSGSIFSAGTNSNSLLRSWLFYDGVLPIAGVAATLPALAIRRLRGPAVAGALLILTALRPGGYLPAMYVVQVLPFFAIVLAGVVAVTVDRLRPP